MVIKHKGKRTDNGEEVIGYVTKMWGLFHITTEEDENTAYPVVEDSIEPCLDDVTPKAVEPDGKKLF